jgi:hypothetical protein
MARFLAFLMIFVVVTAHGSAVAAAICHHQNIAEHIAARQSRDHKVAADSLREEAGADFASKKGSQGASASVQWPAEMLPASAHVEPFRVLEPIQFQPAVQLALKSASVRPLLEPPSA